MTDKTLEQVKEDFKNSYEALIKALDKYVHDTDVVNIDGWIPWNGGGQPVADDVMVVVKWDDDIDVNTAGRYWWGDRNIIAYRIVEEYHIVESNKMVEEPKEERPTLNEYIERRETEDGFNPFSGLSLVSDYIEKHIAPRLK